MTPTTTVPTITAINQSLSQNKSASQLLLVAIAITNMNAAKANRAKKPPVFRKYFPEIAASNASSKLMAAITVTMLSFMITPPLVSVNYCVVG